MPIGTEKTAINMNRTVCLPLNRLFLLLCHSPRVITKTVPSFLQPPLRPLLPYRAPLIACQAVIQTALDIVVTDIRLLLRPHTAPCTPAKKTAVRCVSPPAFKKCAVFKSIRTAGPVTATLTPFPPQITIGMECP